MSKIKSKEYISSSDDSDSDSDKEKEIKKPPKEKKAEKRKSTTTNKEEEESVEKPASKKAKTDEKPKIEKKSKPSSDTSDAAKEGWDLGRMRKLSIMEFKGNKFVNIREYYEAGGELKPGKKGIALKPQEWQKLLEVSDEVNRGCNIGGGGDKEGWELGRMRKITLNEFKGRTLVDIREYYTDAGGDMKPGKKGISLSNEQWGSVLAHADDVNNAL